jgi:hypothetical protein
MVSGVKAEGRRKKTLRINGAGKSRGRLKLSLISSRLWPKAVFIIEI